MQLKQITIKFIDKNKSKIQKFKLKNKINVIIFHRLIKSH